MSSNFPRQQPSVAVFAEATGWLVDFREGRVDAKGRSDFTAWLRRSPEHIQAYMEAAALWDDIPALASGMQIDVASVVAHACAQGKVSRIGTSDGDDRAASVTRARGARPVLALAAGLAAVAVIGALALWFNLGSVYETAIGEQRSITLRDGSIIELGARSRIRVKLSEQRRDVELLSGRALFSVAKDAARPFVVAANAARVRAIGTQFDVNKRPSGTTVTVLEGRVGIAVVSSGTLTVQEDASLLLGAGQQVTLSAEAGHRALRPVAIDTSAIAVPAERTLNFGSVALCDVVEEFNRYNARQIEIADGELELLRISGVFSATKPESLLRFLSESMQLDVRIDADRTRIARFPEKKE